MKKFEMLKFVKRIHITCFFDKANGSSSQLIWILPLYSFFAADSKKKIEFELRGATGSERVEIYNYREQSDPIKEVRISKDWQKFSFSSMDAVRIHFIYDNGDIFLKNPHLYRIEFKDERDFWNCRTKTANIRCKWVQEGKFHWSGNYVVKFDYEGNTLNRIFKIISANEKCVIWISRKLLRWRYNYFRLL